VQRIFNFGEISNTSITPDEVLNVSMQAIDYTTLTKAIMMTCWL